MSWATAGKERHRRLQELNLTGGLWAPKRWALHNPIFLTKHWDTTSLERQRWKQCVHMCVFPLCRCWSLALVMPWGKLRTYCGRTMHKSEYVRRTKEQSGRETMSQSALDLWRCRVLPYNGRTHMKTSPHTSAFPCLSERGLRGPSKRGREIGRGQAGSLSFPLEEQGRLKLAGLLRLPRYSPPLPAHCIRTLEKGPGGANLVD